MTTIPTLGGLDVDQDGVDNDTSGNEAGQEHGEAIVAVTTERQDDADQQENEAGHDALPGKVDGGTIAEEIIQHIGLTAVYFFFRYFSWFQVEKFSW